MYIFVTILGTSSLERNLNRYILTPFRKSNNYLGREIIFPLLVLDVH